MYKRFSILIFPVLLQSISLHHLFRNHKLFIREPDTIPGIGGIYYYRSFDDDVQTWFQDACLLWIQESSNKYQYQYKVNDQNGINKHELSLQHDKNLLKTTSQTHLHFDRLQLQQQADQILYVENKKHEFGQFVVREALIDEEYWTAACLRAETHWEDRTDDRFADSQIRKFTEQEFNALKRQSVTKLGQKSACIITVRKEHRSEKQNNVPNSVVGTLDVSIRPFLHGETFPGEKVKATIFYTKEPKKQYGYISNLCVDKSARRQGVARNMLHFAIESAISDGVEQVYVHVRMNNKAAQELYQKIGFKVVDLASPQLLRDKMYLLSYTP